MSESELRVKAEALLKVNGRTLAAMPENDIQALIHELQVHQIELEMQNEALRATQADLLAARDKYLDLFDFAPIGYVIITESTIIEQANLKACDLLGVERRLLVGQPLIRFVSQESLGTFHTFLQQTARQTGKHSSEFVLQDTKGTRFDAGLDCIAVAATGTAPRFRLALHDISKRRHAERALASSWLQLTENIPDFVFTVNRDGIIQFVNRTWPNVSREQIVGSSLYSYAPPEQHPAIREMLERVFTTGESCRTEMPGRGPTGSIAYYSTSMGPIRQDNAIVAVTMVSTDVTERKHLEERLLQAQKLEAIGQLAGGVAHDFNNQLTVISGFSEIVINNLSTDDPHRELIGEVVKAANHAADLTRQLLAFGRRQIMVPTLVNLNEIVENCEKLVRRVVGTNVVFLACYGESLPSVRVDPQQIEQVIMSLALNANEAMELGGTLTIATSKLDLTVDQCHHYPDSQPGEYVALTIRDTGIGMTPEVLAHLFEPFFTTKKVGMGPGLGLATVYGIVKQSEGHIGVESTPGVGTTVRVIFPAVRGKAATPKSQPHDIIPRGQETVLLVDDEDAVRQVARRMLEMQGYTVLEAATGQEAIRLAETHPRPIHLLVTDVVMPGMSGKQLVELLAPNHPKLRILYVSGYNDDIIQSGSDSESDAFLHKPFSFLSLAKKVREVLDA